MIAFAEDPTGYKWELIERPGDQQEPICQVMLRVSDLERSIAYYRDCLGMKLLRTRDNPGAFFATSTCSCINLPHCLPPQEYKYTLAFMGYGDDEQSQCVFELTYNYGRTDYTKGDAYAQVAISTNDVYKTAEQIKAAGGTITREPGPVPGIGCVWALRS